MITVSINRAYENLANAIIIQAVKDIRIGNCYLRRAKIFLKSEWCRDLSKVDGRMILKRLEDEKLKNGGKCRMNKTTGIVLKTEALQRKDFPVELIDFYVDEVVYTSDSEFENIRNGKDSEILKQYNQKNYERNPNRTNGILVINTKGDGLLIDTQEYNYARYKAYAPQVGSYITEQQTLKMRQEANIELKLYVPLNVTRWDYECDAEESVDENDYVTEIREAVQRENRFETERGLVEYLDAGKVKEKVYKITPAVEMYNGKLLGVAKCLLTENLNAEELDNLKEYCVGQFSGGWGEGFEQREISTSDGNIYVHFWEYSNTYYIKTEEELKQDIEQGQGMQPMQGM